MQPMLFGGDWTEDKLTRVRKYLMAYAKIMQKNRSFRTAYIDAFAGTGYRTLRREENPNLLLLPELMEEDATEFVDGSARIALRVQPRFDKYIFIEKDEARFAELRKLKEEFPQYSEDILLENKDTNEYLIDLCRKRNWTQHRAVLFLDPFGMQVTWDTIQAIAQTQAIDLWYLFPLGIVNRLLRRDGQISDAWRRRLNETLGATDWYEVFYQTYLLHDLFGDRVQVEKVSDFETIGMYFVDRLKTIFAGVAENPLPLLNSRNVPLFLLCFASGNPKGAPTAIKIAQHILDN
jgi:three-Cys-motif partner protein